MLYLTPYQWQGFTHGYSRHAAKLTTAPRLMAFIVSRLQPRFDLSNGQYITSCNLWIAVHTSHALVIWERKCSSIMVNEVDTAQLQRTLLWKSRTDISTNFRATKVSFVLRVSIVLWFLKQTMRQRIGSLRIDLVQWFWPRLYSCGTVWSYSAHICVTPVVENAHLCGNRSMQLFCWVKEFWYSERSWVILNLNLFKINEPTQLRCRGPQCGRTSAEI